MKKYSTKIACESVSKRKTLLIDVDECICFGGFLDAVNEFLKTNYVIDDFTNYYIEVEAFQDEDEKFIEFQEYLMNRNLYENAYVLPNAIEVIERLNKVYDVYILSSCINVFKKTSSGRLFKDKFDFLIKTLPFISPDKYIFTSSKHLFVADSIIDDKLSNLENSSKEKILFPSYHNKNVSDTDLSNKGVIRAGTDWRNGWNEVKKILLEK